MPTALIIGSGPSAAGAALALAEREDLQIVVLDLGLQLEQERQQVVGQLAERAPGHWDRELVELVSAQPVNSAVKGLPEKRAYGSDFAFRDIGQLGGVVPDGEVNGAVVSSAYGGFSNVWGSQIMPFTDATFATWPVSGREMEPHYRSVLQEVPLAGQPDDLAELFPLLDASAPLPEVSQRTAQVLRNYGRHRAKVRNLGVTLGRARLAFDASQCVRCGLCMTGCPYRLIYSASSTFDRLRRTGRIAYHSNLMAVRVGEDAGRAFVWARSPDSDQLQRFDADRVYVACGAMGSTRLVGSSLGLYDTKISMGESAQFGIPFVSFRPTGDPTIEPQFTLNQFNMLIRPNHNDVDLALLHFYTYNPAFEGAVPAFLRAPAARPGLDQLLRRLSVALGYLPSWASPGLQLQLRRSSSDAELPRMDVSRDDVRWRDNVMLRGVITRLARSARHLDLWPIVPSLFFSGGAKSYHFGASFPHEATPTSAFASDTLGRVASWKRIHMIDAAVFPSVPATTFTLTIMANAHRIATESLGLIE
jgi:hypothetical protein